MDPKRPNPEQLLKQISAKEQRQNLGKLKIFFGYAAGVGKTFAMLTAAHEAKKEGLDVVAGYIEPQARPETLALQDGLESIPFLEIPYKNVVLKEFDLDAALNRKPRLILVDELAHTNAAGCRNLKRYQDVQELLKAGIDVYGTVNVQHLESLKDIVASITKIQVRERIPDDFFDSADQVELIDIEPDDLLERFREGKVYKGRQAATALDNFFTKENLTALREISLRRTADHINKDDYELTAPKKPFTEEHVLLCLSNSLSSAKVIRSAARMADALHGQLTALVVEDPANVNSQATGKENLKNLIKLAEQQGAEINIVSGYDTPYEIAEYAKAAGVSKIVIGRKINPKKLWRRRDDTALRITEMASNIDVYVIPEQIDDAYISKKSQGFSLTFSASDLAKSLAIMTIATLINFCLYKWNFEQANFIAIYILSVLVIAAATDAVSYSGISAILAVLSYNYFFTLPQYSLAVYRPENILTMVIMFSVAFISGTLAKRLKQQARQAALKASHTEMILEMNRKLQQAKSKDDIFTVTGKQIRKLLGQPVIIYPAENDYLGQPLIFSDNIQLVDNDQYLSSNEQAVAMWVYKNNKAAGATTDTLQNSACLYWPASRNDNVWLIVAIPIDQSVELDIFEKNLLTVMLQECALALENEELTNRKFI